jgi:GNAT superfamily N-acetyltransferase
MTLSDQVAEIGNRIERTGIRIKEALSVIDATFDDQMSRLHASSPYEAFTGLNTLIDRTVHGARIESFGPRKGTSRFHTLEIHTEEGEILGYLNMLHLKRPLPCYYLVYVEVMPSFRGLGLGSRILSAFMGFLKDEGAVGLLDNIIPADEPSYEMYRRVGWKVLAEYVENDVSDELATYMIFIPDSVRSSLLKEDLVRILLSLKKRRAVIDMHYNVDMVKRTIEEFVSIYRALVQLFHDELASGASPPLLRFMFTRLTTKLIGFHRRITTLIGYTGGESLQQLSFSDDVLGLPIQPYSLWNLAGEDAGAWGDHEVLRGLPHDLKEEPTFFIESLPLYKRPYVSDWMKKTGAHPCAPLTIGDLLDCGLDPTRLREFHHEGVDYIFERIAPLLFSSLLKKRDFLRRVEQVVSGVRFRQAIGQVNPILLIFRDRGNTYVLRRKLGGVHSQEALDQLMTMPHLKELNRAVRIDTAVTGTIKDARDFLRKEFASSFRREIDELTYFVPWDIEQNFPRVTVDVSGISLNTLWIS